MGHQVTKFPSQSTPDIRTGDPPFRAIGLEMLRDFIVPKYLLLRGTLGTEEGQSGQFGFQHPVEVTEAGINLLAISFRALLVTAFSFEGINAFQTCRAIAALAFLWLLYDVLAEHALEKYCGIRLLILAHQVNGEYNLFRLQRSHIGINLGLQLRICGQDEELIVRWGPL